MDAFRNRTGSTPSYRKDRRGDPFGNRHCGKRFGGSFYPRDAAARIGKTPEIIESLIGEKGATLKDIRSATVY